MGGVFLAGAPVVLQPQDVECAEDLPHLFIREVVVWHVPVDGVDVDPGVGFDFLPGQGLGVLRGGDRDEGDTAGPHHPEDLGHGMPDSLQKTMLDNRI